MDLKYVTSRFDSNLLVLTGSCSEGYFKGLSMGFMRAEDEDSIL